MDVLTDEELAAQEDAAWDEHERRKAVESEDGYDGWSRVTQDGELPEAWRDEHMMREV